MSGAIAHLGGGLVLRRATKRDADALAAFNARIHGSPEAPSDGIATWTRDLLSGAHPTTGPDDFTVVEHAPTGAIVSSLVLISQRWSYGGIEFGVGRPELVGSLPEYRRRGLIRRQMEVVHRWSEERGELMQAITGIPWYYRQFSYDLALQAHTPRAGSPHNIPKLPEGQPEPYRVRPATEADLPFLVALHDQVRTRYLLTVARDRSQWRYELSGRSEGSEDRLAVCIIERADGPDASAPAGYLAHWPVRSATIYVRAYELLPDASWLEVSPSVLRYLAGLGAAWERSAPGRRFESYWFSLAANHPVYRTLPSCFPLRPRPEADYVRVPDLACFLRQIAPALEARLRASAAAYTGELNLSFYRDGVRLAFERGRLTRVEHWPQPERSQASAAFPEHTFLHLLFGRLTLDELQHVFTDCLVRGDTARLLVEALFPQQPSHVWYLS